MFDLLGGVKEREVRLLFSTFFVFLIMYIFGISRRLGGGALLAAILALFYCATPFRDDWSERDGGALNSGAVDIPLSFFALISITGFLLWWRERQRWQFLLGVLFGAFCLLTKKEGLVILAVTSFGNGLQALFGAGIENRKKAFGYAVMASVLMVLVASPGLFLGMKMPNFYDEKFGEMINWEVLSQIHTRVPIVVVTTLQEIINTEKWNYYWIIFITMLVFAIPGWFKHREFYIDAILLAWIGIYFFVYLVSPLNLIFHLNTSTSRLASHFLPLL